MYPDQCDALCFLKFVSHSILAQSNAMFILILLISFTLKCPANSICTIFGVTFQYLNPSSIALSPWASKRPQLRGFRGPKRAKTNPQSGAPESSTQAPPVSTVERRSKSRQDTVIPPPIPPRAYPSTQFHLTPD